ncbi:MAG: response regulator transcription factor [Acidimicrobiales bacterium]
MRDLRRLVHLPSSQPVLCSVHPVPPEWEMALSRAGYEIVSAPNLGAAVAAERAAGAFRAALVGAPRGSEDAAALCRHLRSRDQPVPVLLLVYPEDLEGLGPRRSLFDDFCLMPVREDELVARLGRLVEARADEPNVVEHGPLVLNLETYQAGVAGRALDLTYMEYQLLRFLATNPGRVFTRETLLNRVWGYEYYGGERTVDVHVRRLRAKLGEEHAHLIETVRSVGYRLGQGPWSPSHTRAAASGDDRDQDQISAG